MNSMVTHKNTITNSNIVADIKRIHDILAVFKAKNLQGKVEQYKKIQEEIEQLEKDLANLEDETREVYEDLITLKEDIDYEMKKNNKVDEKLIEDFKKLEEEYENNNDEIGNLNNLLFEKIEEKKKIVPFSWDEGGHQTSVNFNVYSEKEGHEIRFNAATVNERFYDRKKINNWFYLQFANSVSDFDLSDLFEPKETFEILNIIQLFTFMFLKNKSDYILEINSEDDIKRVKVYDLITRRLTKDLGLNLKRYKYNGHTPKIQEYPYLYLVTDNPQKFEEDEIKEYIKDFIKRF